MLLSREIFSAFRLELEINDAEHRYFFYDYKKTTSVSQDILRLIILWYMKIYNLFLWVVSRISVFRSLIDVMTFIHSLSHCAKQHTTRTKEWNFRFLFRNIFALLLGDFTINQKKKKKIIGQVLGQ